MCFQGIKQQWAHQWFDTYIDSRLLAGMPGSAPGQPTTRPNSGTAMFPPVLRTEVPSSVILKYMDGLSKRSVKITDTQFKSLGQSIVLSIYTVFP